MLSGLIKKISSTLTPTLTVSFIADLSMGQTLTMSCAAMSGALSIAVPEIVDLRQEQKSSKRNGLDFLLRLSDEAK
jgi:hypothetical protein